MSTLAERKRFCYCGEMAKNRVSRSGQALDQTLQRGGAAAEAVLATGIHVTQLWRYKTGRGRPGAANTAKLHRATGGKVAAEGWADYT
jgi:hypothetical protein